MSVCMSMTMNMGMSLIVSTNENVIVTPDKKT